MGVNKNTVVELMENINNSIQSKVSGILSIYSSIKWRRVTFTIPTTPVPSHRPRLSGYRVYVPGAAKNQSFFNKHVLPKLKGLFITTPCKIEVNIFCPTPKSFSKTQQILAEMGVIRPWVNTGDVDNYLKSVMDQIQPNEKRGHIGIMSNDCLVISSTADKYYSINPRYEVTISYMTDIPESIRKTLRINEEL